MTIEKAASPIKGNSISRRYFLSSYGNVVQFMFLDTTIRDPRRYKYIIISHSVVSHPVNNLLFTFHISASRCGINQLYKNTLMTCRIKLNSENFNMNFIFHLLVKTSTSAMFFEKSQEKNKTAIPFDFPPFFFVS